MFKKKKKKKETEKRKEMTNIDLKWFAKTKHHIQNTSSNRISLKYTKAKQILQKCCGKDNNESVGNSFILKYDKGFHANDQTQLEGLTTELKKLFFQLNDALPTGGAKTGGVRRGNEVDYELKQLVNNQVIKDQIWDYNQYTIKILKEMKDKNIRPFWAQVPVGDLEMKLATNLDILCVDQKGKIINIQIKTTGLDTNYEKTTGKMMSLIQKSPIIQGIDDSLKMRHIVQATVEHYLAQTHFDNIIDRTEVWTIFSNVERPLTMNISDHITHVQTTEILNELLNRHTKTKLKIDILALRKRYAIKCIREKLIAKNRKKRQSSLLR
jgi:hypothetical protein